MNLETIKYIHEFLANYFEFEEDPISPVGVKDQSLLESAIARPFVSVGGKDAYETPVEKAAVLFHGVINNHAFFNGNKRTALLSTLHYLGENNLTVDKVSDDEMFEFTRQIAAHEISDDRDEEVATIVDWLNSNSRKQVKGERCLKFSDLKEILNNFEFDVEEDGQLFSISKNGRFYTKIIIKGKNNSEDYDKNYMSTLRKKLQLTQEYGIDSMMFYGDKGIATDLNEFMEMRYEVMRQLAKI